MAQTLEQLRAQNAWECATKTQSNTSLDYDKYVNFTKGVPALIMSSGLMQVLAFCHEKGKKDNYKHCEEVATHLRVWLSKCFPRVFAEPDFSEFIQALMKTAPQDYQAINAEAFAWLKWLRQMAAARKGGE